MSEPYLILEIFVLLLLPLLEDWFQNTVDMVIVVVVVVAAAAVTEVVVLLAVARVVVSGKSYASGKLNMTQNRYSLSSRLYAIGKRSVKEKTAKEFNVIYNIITLSISD